MMEIEKLIEILRGKCAVCKRSSCNGKYWQLSSCPATCEAADALEQLQAENDRLKEEVQQMRWIPVEERPPEEIGNYAYPPVHINREAWKPCEHCKPKCRICANCSILYKCGEPQDCADCKDYSNFYSDYNYCDYCGRPLTEEAWKELEKRVRGEK